MQRENHRLAAMVAAETAGYSRLIGQDEEGTLRALRAHRQQLIDRLIDEHGGRIANTVGDNLLLEFPSNVDAVRCVLDVPRGIATRNHGVPVDQSVRCAVQSARFRRHGQLGHPAIRRSHRAVRPDPGL